MFEAFFAFVNCIINKKKTNRWNTKRLEKLVLVCLFKNRIRIESARVRGSDRGGRDVFLADS